MSRAQKPTKSIPPLTERDIARFWSKVDVRGPDECWPWKSKLNPDGYGRMQISRSGFRAHRIAYFIQHGIDPGELLSCHTCDNPPCCNGRHLFRGTQADNNADRHQKGRTATGDRSPARLHPESLPRGDQHHARTHPERLARGDRHGSHTHPEKWVRGDSHPWHKRPRRGELNGRAKLAAAEVAEIRRRYAAGGVMQKDLAKEFRISPQTISVVVKNQLWREPIAGAA